VNLCVSAALRETGSAFSAGLERSRSDPDMLFFVSMTGFPYPYPRLPLWKPRRREMVKRILSCAAMATLALTAANSAGAQGIQYIPTIDFYSDATLTQIVGHAQAVCRSDFAGTILVWGYSTQYQVQTDTRPCGPGYYDDE
jgi:hypothetical protein